MIVAQMSATTDCGCNPCNPVVSPVPGTAGESAYATNTAVFDVPPLALQNVNVNFSNTGWLVTGMNVVFSGPFTFRVANIAGLLVALTWLDNDGDGVGGTSVAIGTKVVPTGVNGAPVPNPLPVAEGGTGATTVAGAQAVLGSPAWAIGYGGTGATTKAAAQTALGLGQSSTVSTVAALAQVITASATQIAGSDITVGALGTYLVTGSVSIDYTGVTFAASRVITVTVRNVTQGVDIITVTRNTGILTTLGLPTQDIKFPETVYSGAAVNDHIQVRISVSVINTAGTFAVLASTCAITPLRLT